MFRFDHDRESRRAGNFQFYRLRVNHSSDLLHFEHGVIPTIYWLRQRAECVFAHYWAEARTRWVPERNGSAANRKSNPK